MSRPRDLARRLLRPILGPVATQRLAGLVVDQVAAAQYALTAEGRRSAARLASYANRYAGQRCFVIGNGPSLKRTDLSLLRNEYTFGLNRVYLLFEEIGFATTFLVAINRFVLEQSAAEIQGVPCPKFLHWGSRHAFTPAEDLAFLRVAHAPRFSADPTREALWDGATVTYVALQLAFYFGFARVVLIGVDHSFTTPGPAHHLVTSTGEDPNHFHPAYFGKGYRWQLPDLEMSEIAYRMARARFEAAGRSVVDATVGGKLQVFPKVEYGSLFGEAARPTKGATR